MAIPYKKDKALCSPTSDLEKGTNVERGAEESFVTDRDKLIVETLGPGPESRRHWGHINDIMSRLWLRHNYDDKEMKHDGRGLEKFGVI